jgi:type II secretory pathway pseudopilin PulG
LAAVNLPSIRPDRFPRQRTRSAFTLVELLVVIGIIVLLTTLLVPAFTTLKRSGDITASLSDVNSALEAGRTFAIANNTYVWAGFFEEDVVNTPSTTPRPAGTGRIIISIVAAKDGTRYKDTQVDATTPHAFYAPPGPSPIAGNDSNAVILTQVGKLVKVDNAHLAIVSSTVPSRPVVSNDYQVGAGEFAFHPPTLGTTQVLNPTSFNYPLSAVAPDITYVFTKIIEFSPRGEALKIVDLPTQFLEIGLQPTHGNAADTSAINVATIQLAGSTGRTKIYRP